MPIATSWKKMLSSLKKQYTDGDTECRDMADGTKYCMTKHAWRVFYATLRTKGWDETKPASKLALSAEFIIDPEEV